MRSLLWFRGRDLRLEDQPAVLAAAEGRELIPLVVLDPKRRWSPFRTSFQDRALDGLNEALKRLGTRLVVLEGEPEEQLLAAATRWRVARLETLARVESEWRAMDGRLEAQLGERFRAHTGDTLVEPGSLRTGSGGPFAVFTPFARALQRQAQVRRPLPAPLSLPPLPSECAEAPGWTGAVPGESAACRLRAFLDDRLEGYGTGRNALGRDGISRLSADLRAGTLSVRSLWHAVAERFGQGLDDDIRTYLNELLWREFAHHTLWERPDLVSAPFRTAWRDFPWRKDAQDLEAWKQGRTGHPVVDAAARELLATGFVHNRARMVAASFLTKHLMLDWRLGEAHYRELLVDGCAAANSLNWQWSAGCGVDAQPWFRIFRPETQGKRFDAEGAYVRRWVPELREVPDRYRLTPHAWGGPVDYPEPIVDHAFGRARFLETAKHHLGP